MTNMQRHWVHRSSPHFSAADSRFRNREKVSRSPRDISRENTREKDDTDPGNGKEKL